MSEKRQSESVNDVAKKLKSLKLAHHELPVTKELEKEKKSSFKKKIKPRKKDSNDKSVGKATKKWKNLSKQNIDNAKQKLKGRSEKQTTPTEGFLPVLYPKFKNSFSMSETPYLGEIKSHKKKKESNTDKGKDGKPEWAKVKDEILKLREHRKMRRTGEENYSLFLKAKKIWEKVRIKTISKDKREGLVNELFMMLKGKISNIVRSHDMARVVQSMLKLGSPTVRSAICEELCSNTGTYLQEKYASYCVNSALYYGCKVDRNNLIQSCNGHFLKLLANAFASPIVEKMYSKFASKGQRHQMHRELYGEMHALLPSDVVYINQISPDLRPSILAATKTNLTKLLAKKESLRSTLLQNVLYDYMGNCSEEDRTEITELFQGDFLQLHHTWAGCRVALFVIWSATNKMKKFIVKSLKGNLKEIATSKQGHILLLALFDSIDDTVLVNKVLIPELLEEAEEIAKDEFGRKIILYLVAHRDPRYFHPEQIKVLSKGDSISTRKKDTQLREKELLEAVSTPLLQKIAKDPAFWLGISSVSMVALAILESGMGPALQQAFNSVVEYILDPKSLVEDNDSQFHVIEHSAVHLVLKKLIQQDQKLNKDNFSDTFMSALVDKLSEETLKHILQFNRGCFLLVLLYETENPSVCTALNSKLTDLMKSFLNKQETTGAQILLKKCK